jgi:hypothetical protein
MHCEPRIAVIPDQVKTAGPHIIRLARMGGIRLDDAQQLVANATGGVGADGRWSAFECVIFAPRQNLKTEYLLARILAGLYLFREELIVFSAHRASTTTKVFRRLKRSIDRSPQLGARIERVSNRIGQERIELTSGQAVEMCARSTSSGRGFTGDTVILDESHELDGEQLAAILPMVSTRRNPQILYALSLGNEHTSHVGGLRERALAGRDGVCWIEWSLADDDAVDDRRVWAACNPAFHAGRISMEYMEREFSALGPERFARERLGRSEWPSGEPGDWQVISQAQWDACMHPAEPAGWMPVPVVADAPKVRPAWETWPDTVPPWVKRRGSAIPVWLLAGGMGLWAYVRSGWPVWSPPWSGRANQRGVLLWTLPGSLTRNRRVTCPRQSGPWRSLRWTTFGLRLRRCGMRRRGRLRTRSAPRRWGSPIVSTATRLARFPGPVRLSRTLMMRSAIWPTSWRRRKRSVIGPEVASSSGRSV